MPFVSFTFAIDSSYTILRFTSPLDELLITGVFICCHSSALAALTKLSPIDNSQKERLNMTG